MSTDQNSNHKGFIGKHPVIANIAIIILVAVLGIWIVYLSLALFTKHGQSEVVPSVENMSYTKAVSILHDQGFNVDIRDSVYKDNVRPGYVIEQFPKPNSEVKPGRKIFLYINAVHPKEVVIDDGPNAQEYALRSQSYRTGLARLEELGFKNIKVVRVLGVDNCIVKITANGQPVRKMQRVPINARIVIEISDGRLQNLRDSLYQMETIRSLQEQEQQNPVYEDPYSVDPGYNPSVPAPQEPTPAPAPSQEEEGIEYF
ncbi:MAG: PASTA domain-containing protein [Muribaculum sp.]|nr:PASTA domain-containing protein [Muribaculum sp.]